MDFQMVAMQCLERLARQKSASSAEFVGAFWLWKLTEVV